MNKVVLTQYTTGSISKYYSNGLYGFSYRGAQFNDVWGWSTCKDSAGTNVRHYTVAQYETTVGGQVRASSGRIWVTGKVWAYSDWVANSNPAFP